MLPNCKQELINALKGNHPLIYIVSEDERTVIDTILHFIEEDEEDFNFYSWDAAKRLRNIKTGLPVPMIETPGVTFPYQTILDNLAQSKRNRIQAIFDFDTRFDADEAASSKFIRSVKEFMNQTLYPANVDFDVLSEQVDDKKIKKIRRHLVLVSPTLHIPKEWENITHVVQIEIPEKEEMLSLVSSFAEQEGVQLEERNLVKITEACLGLSETEAILALRKSFHLNDKKTITVDYILSEREHLIQQKGMIDFPTTTGLTKESVGGFDQFFAWIQRRKLLFDKENREKFNLPAPRGALLTGVQGTGKTLAAQVIAKDLGFPIVQLNVACLTECELGKTDTELHNALRTIERMAPCVLLMDEMEQSIHLKEEADKDNQRAMDYLWTWLKVTEAPIFLLATVNRTDLILLEQIRKGRFDEVWFSDLPTLTERINILQIHLEKHNISLSKDDVLLLATHTANFAGAEIEKLITESALTAIYEDRDITVTNLLSEVSNITPLALIQRERVTALRDWAFRNKVKYVTSRPMEHL